MRILLNGLSLLKPKTGVGQYVSHLKSGLGKSTKVGAIDVFPGQKLSQLLGKKKPKPGGPPKPTSQWKNRFSTLGKDLARTAARAHFAAFSRTFDFDLYHEPNFLPYPCHKPTVVTVHDLSVWHHPEWHPADRVCQHRKRFEQGIRNASHIIVVSDAVKQELIQEFGLSSDKVTRVYNGISDAFRPYSEIECNEVKQRLRLPSQYFLAVGSIEPRKNLLTVLKAFVDLPQAIRQVCPLVLAGPWGWKSDNVREYFETDAKAAGVIQLGYVTDDDLPAVYAGATALVFPTLYEGFGLPPLEMAATGGQVLVSDIAVLREVLKTHATYLPSEDVASWRTGMETAFEKGPQRNNLAVKYAKQFSWANNVEETLMVYEKVLGIASNNTLRLAA